MIEDGWRTFGCCPTCGQLVHALFLNGEVPASCPTCQSALGGGLSWVSSAKFHYGSKNMGCVGCGAALPQAVGACATCGLARDETRVADAKLFVTCSCPFCAKPMARTAIRCPSCQKGFGPPIARLDDDDPGDIVVACPYCVGFLCEIRKGEEAPAPTKNCPYCWRDMGRDAPLEFDRNAFVRNVSDGFRCPRCDSETREGAVVCGACRKALPRAPEPDPEREAKPKRASRLLSAASRRRPLGWLGLFAVAAAVALVAAVVPWQLERRRADERLKATDDAVGARVSAARGLPWDARFDEALHRLPSDVVLPALPGDPVDKARTVNTLVVTYETREGTRAAPDDILNEAQWIWACEALVRDPSAHPEDSRRVYLESCASAKYVLGLRLEMEVPPAERPGFRMNFLSKDWTVSKWTYRGSLLLVRVEPGAPRGGSLVARRWVEFDVPNHSGTRQQALFHHLGSELAYWKDREPSPCPELLREGGTAAIEQCVDRGSHR